jgi:prophage regulatory protein
MANDTAVCGTTAARILRQPEVEWLTGLSGDLIALLEEQNQFPRRVPLTTRTVGWVEGEVANWIQERIGLRDDAVKAAQLKFDRSPPAVRHRLRMQRERTRKNTPSPAVPAEVRKDKRQLSLWASWQTDDGDMAEASAQPVVD